MDKAQAIIKNYWLPYMVTCGLGGSFVSVWSFAASEIKKVQNKQVLQSNMFDPHSGITMDFAIFSIFTAFAGFALGLVHSITLPITLPAFLLAKALCSKKKIKDNE